MRLLAALVLVFGSAGAAHAQQPPHAFMQGIWAGGLYPVLNTQIETACRADPTLLVRGDDVARTTLTVQGLFHRTIATVRVVPGGLNIEFAPEAGGVGFGCETPDVLHVQRSGDEMTFPGCSDFPYPLVKCR